MNESQSGAANGILQLIENAKVSRTGTDLLLTQKDIHTPIQIVFTRCQGLGVQYDQNQWWALPISATSAQVHANRALWILPLDATSTNHSWHLVLHGGDLDAKQTEAGLTITLHAESATLSESEARPHSDPFGHRFSLDIPGGAKLEEALAAFYWGTMLPSVVEKTMAANFSYSSGYVLSTLNVNSYAGSYPSVDHEFQIKGRIALGSELDLDIVKRMIGLQFKLMNDDPEKLYRMPTSVQPDGRREYHVRRNSEDNHQNAAMFPVTGNIEVIEESWRYYEARKNLAWLRSDIVNLEHSAQWVLTNTDQYGRVWSDVYYEDQVIKDGRVTQAQAFAAHAFSLLADMETLLGRRDEASLYSATSKKMATALIAPLPMGYWNPASQRFIDWVDRNGEAHDHLHLLANELPVTFGYATPDQTAAVRHLIKDNADQFERFPSFVAADIAGYDKSEIGDGGPYDLCAAGRYWYWDAAFRTSQSQSGILLDQLNKVAAEAAKNSYFMSERYDMDHVYYVDGKDAHGAEKYYEYPNVFAAVLIDKFLGLTVPADADLAVAPHLTSYGSVDFEIPEYAIRYSYSKNGFAIKNLSDKPRRYKVDLSALAFHAAHYQLTSSSGSKLVTAHSTLTLPPQQEAHWTPVQ
ncbi:hypothetical protein GCM10011507_01780 [Edaphobacter acidisoli]|uniref:Alpha-L-rhamnosidase six-hairpin glycosidase domain-containing protein n=1 Tax=Edaphobacter acidisoli TaxID=2040573 RepID=A0A916RFJ4_9BACT|nr:hypothetical protein GCM10011507_01780 [Edaphobacter acidisoli]